MSESTDKAKGTTGGHGAAVILMIGSLLLLPLVYVLSLGPAILYVEATDNDTEAFDVIYMPLRWLYDNVPATQPVFDWYVNFFE